MGNQQNTGLLLFTLYQRGQPARFWPCHLAEHVEGTFSGKANSVDMFSPLGPGSESDVYVSDLSITAPLARSGDGGVTTINIRFTFAGSTRVNAPLNLRATWKQGWSAAMTGPTGQPVVLHVEFKASQLEQPYGEPMAQGSGSR